MRTGRLCLASLLLLAVAGCSGGLLEDLLPSDRLEVTGRLRAACPTRTDAEIDSLIVLVENARTSGADKSDALFAGTLGCGSSGECTTCMVAITDQVYGG